MAQFNHIFLVASSKCSEYHYLRLIGNHQRGTPTLLHTSASFSKQLHIVPTEINLSLSFIPQYSGQFWGSYKILVVPGPFAISTVCNRYSSTLAFHGSVNHLPTKTNLNFARLITSSSAIFFTGNITTIIKDTNINALPETKIMVVRKLTLRVLIPFYLM